ncbi:uncharacterized protein [Nicotiana sylvestris]|uniref:uncharacterized protein n=1 Tax=Nicotiana sylvestris TaxID=4096 RepID=UPI00388C8096
MINATTGYEAMSFIDGSSDYNQIRMTPKDEELTAFCTPKGIYCYKVMPFGLKTTGATYQRAMQNIFDDLLHKNVECYVDDLVVKSREKGDHMKDLRMVFELLRRYQLRMNPLKCAFGVTSGKFLVQPPWKMYFDGAAHRGRAGAGVVFVTPQGEVLPYFFTLTQLCSNNVAEYQALIIGLEMAIDMKQLQLQVFGDSQLVVNQLLLMGWLGDVTIQHVPRKENKKADALTTLALSLALPDQAHVTIYQKWLVPPLNEAEGEENKLKHLVAVSEVEKEEWRQPIIDYLCYGILLENTRRRTEIRRRAPRFLYYKDTLYRRLMNKICELFGFKQRNSSMYNVATNGLVEAFNKTLCNLLKKVVSKSKKDWNDRMEEALWRQIPSLRLAIQEGITDEENARLRLTELEALDEKRLEAQQSLECYQARLSRAFNKRVRPRSFQVGDQVLAVRIPIITSHKPVRKFTSNGMGHMSYKKLTQVGLTSWLM